LFEAHFHKRKSAIDGTEDAELWQKIRPKDSYVVRTFDEVKSNTSPLKLPYDKVSASPTFDIWSLGTIIYAFCSGAELFNTNRDTDCENGAALASLYSWTDEIKQKTIFENVHDELAQNLLIKMLSRNPTDRFQTMGEVLSHPFFGSTNNDSHLTLINAKLQKEAEIRIQALEKKLKEKGVNVDEIQHKLTAARDTKRKSIKAEQNSVNIASIIKAQFEEHTQLMLRETREIKNQLNRAEHFQKKILAKTTTILKVSEATQLKLENSTSSILKGMLEIQISCPTSYVILPTKLQVADEEEEGEDADHLATAQALLDDAQANPDYVAHMIEMAQEKFNTADLAAQGMEKMKNYFCDENFYLYLVNEKTGKPAVGGNYPIEIKTNSQNLDKFLPMMKLGVKAASVVNAGMGVARMFGIPAPKVPKNIMDKAKAGIEMLDKESSIAEFDLMQEGLSGAAGGGTVDKKSLRGKALKEFQAFLIKHDPISEFAGLCKVCAPDGSLMWCTAKEVEELQRGGGGGGVEIDDSERADMANKIARLEEKLQEKENKTKTENLEFMRTTATTADDLLAQIIMKLNTAEEKIINKFEERHDKFEAAIMQEIKPHPPVTSAPSRRRRPQSKADNIEKT